MKFAPKKKVARLSMKKRRGSRGPAPSVSSEGASRMIFWLPTPFRNRVNDFNKAAKKVGVKELQFATIFRDGGDMYMSQQEKKLELAKKGRLHAKRREE